MHSCRKQDEEEDETFLDAANPFSFLSLLVSRASKCSSAMPVLLGHAVSPAPQQAAI